MASTSNLEITAASSSSSSSPITWDVFLSFYGDDTRTNFTSHLYSALDHAGIVTFRDDPALEKGQEISPGLLNAIRDSKMFVVVISENYARSPWCLKELADILSCKKTEKQVVPVFYYVNPSDVRYQKGSFGDALDYHYEKKQYSPDMIDNWKSALAQIAEISGYHLKKDPNENESKTIQSIVENIAPQVSTKVLHLGGEHFGVDSAVEEIYQKLSMESNDVRAFGICGMGGIGKTTIAKEFYNKYYDRFDTCCFVDNVKQYSQGGSPLLPLLQQLLTALLKRKDSKVPDVDSGIRQLKQFLRFKRALIVLDNLDQASCSDFLARYYNLFSAGSRIVITTRDVNLLNQLKINIFEVDVHMVNKLDHTHSLEVFNYHAFGEPTVCANLSANLRELSDSFVKYAGGLPLALKVLGSSLRGRTQDEGFWRAKLEKVEKIPENGIMEILQLSYNELDDDTVKSIFLDIACFFLGKHGYEALDIFESCDYHPKVGIKILLERCLLTINEDNMFHMHDLIQDMGRKIAQNTHLFLRENALEYLQVQEGLDKVEGLVLDLTQSSTKQIDSQIFEKLPKLRLLEIRSDVLGIEGNFKNSFQELRCIYWKYCPWTSLPSSFQPKNLIVIQMPFSNFKILWDDTKPFTRLKLISVEYCTNLKTTPNFEYSKSIKRLYFRGCESLLNVHPSIRELTGLFVLDLSECIYVKTLADTLGQSSEMCYLYLGYCRNLRQLPKQLGDMKWLKELDASHTAIEELPDSITQLKELVSLNLNGCKKLKKLREQIGNMEALRTFSANNTAIEQLPDSFVNLINLELLDLRSCGKLKNLPNCLWKLKLLRVLNLDLCSKLERLPNKLEKMQCLEELYASFTAIEEVPDSIGLLSRLRVLELSCCKKLKYLPDCVWNVTSLTALSLYQTDISRISLPAIVKDTKLENLALKCDVRVWLPVILSFPAKQLVLTDDSESSSSAKQLVLSELCRLQYLQLRDCTNFGLSFPKLPLNITHLDLVHHATLVNLPDLSGLKKLKKLEIKSYISLESLSPLPPHLQLLTVYYCPSLQRLSDMSMLKELSDLQFGRKKSVGLKKSFRQVRKKPKIAEWLSYKSSGRTVSFNIPTLSTDNILGLALSVLFTSVNNNCHFSMKADVTNKTTGTTKSCLIPVRFSFIGGEEYYLVKCISRDEISIRSGDRITISLQRKSYNYTGSREVPDEPVKVEMFAAHVIQRTPSTPNFPSVLNNLIN